MMKRTDHTYVDEMSRRLEIARRSGEVCACIGKGKQRKHRYKTLKQALVASYSAASVDLGSDLIPYPCPFCGGYHIGNGVKEEISSRLRPLLLAGRGLFYGLWKGIYRYV